MFILQLYDTDTQVAMEAADVLDEACEDEVSSARASRLGSVNMNVLVLVGLKGYCHGIVVSISKVKTCLCINENPKTMV